MGDNNTRYREIRNALDHTTGQKIILGRITYEI